LVTLADVSANVGYADGPKVNTVSMGATGVLRQLECDVDDAGVVSDSVENLVDLIRSSSASQDVIIVAGGGSERVIERIRAALGTLDGADLGQFASRPITVGQVGACTVLGIAGPGASLLASLVLFVRPLLLHRMGAAERVVPAFAVRAGFELSRRPGHGQWLYARLEADLEAGPVARVFRTGSDDMLGAMIGAEGLVELPGDCSRVTPGDRVNYLPLDLLTAA
jgi:molybdopterin molybdotransferase